MRCFIVLVPRIRVTNTEEEALITKYRPEYDLKVIGKNLKRLRKEKKLSVEDVRKYLRLGTVQAVYKYEKGKCYPQTDTMFALMEQYGATLFDIVYDHEEDYASSSFIFGQHRFRKLLWNYQKQAGDCGVA